VGHQVRPARRPPPAGWANYYKFDGIDWPTSAARSGTLGWLIERRQKFRDSALLLVSRGAPTRPRRQSTPSEHGLGEPGGVLARRPELERRAERITHGGTEHGPDCSLTKIDHVHAPQFQLAIS